LATPLVASLAALQAKVGLLLFVAEPLRGFVRVGKLGGTVSITMLQYPE
jgi:hypothetical protein